MLMKWKEDGLKMILTPLNPVFRIIVREPATACDFLCRSPTPWKFIWKHKSVALCDSSRQSATAWDYLKKVEPVQLLRHLPSHPGYSYMETQKVAACDSSRQSASLLLLRINHMLITAQSNAVNFPTNLRYNIHHFDLQIPHQAALLLQIVPYDPLRLYGNRSTGRLPAIDAGSRRQSPAPLWLYGNQA